MPLTQLIAARKGIITTAIESVAKQEKLTPNQIREGVARGSITIPANIAHSNLHPCGIGEGLRIKVNANIGTSPDYYDPINEFNKLKAAIAAGTDTIMDLSTSGDLKKLRRQILDNCSIPIGTVPIYQVIAELIQQKQNIIDFNPEDLFRVIENQAQEGIDFMTVHCGITQTTLKQLKSEGRLTDIVSRGGAFLACWILANNKENPLYNQYDRLLEIARTYDITLSLGDALRPGCLADASDRAQLSELIILGELTQRAWNAGVQIMIEGPGHMPLNQIKSNVILQKRLCHNAPFYVLGPLVTDIATGHDHIACAIGGALAAWAGADFLCYVTPTEHLALPNPQQVYEGVIATRIAAHSADIARGRKTSLTRDQAMAKARHKMDWKAMMKLCLDPISPRILRAKNPPNEEKVCSMCGHFCALRLVNKYLYPKNTI